MHHFSMYLLITLCLLLCSCGGRTTSSLSSDLLPLTNGERVERLTLSNKHLRLSVVPALGGKITSLQNHQGREFLSRSRQPYVMRRYGMPYNETEQDGIDECFPTHAASYYPRFPWADRPIPDHGEVCQLPWDVLEHTSNSINMRVRGKAFPYLFQRRIEIEGRSVMLHYRVDNLSANPFYCSYTFQPLFAAEAGCHLTLPEDTHVTLISSSDPNLGEADTTALWTEYLTKDGKLLQEHFYQPESGQHCVLYTQKLKTGYARLDYPDGFAVSMSWPARTLPYIGLYCSQGAPDALQHIGIQASSSQYEKMHKAFQQQQSLMITGNSSLSWNITLTIDEPVEDQSETTNQ